MDSQSQLFTRFISAIVGFDWVIMLAILPFIIIPAPSRSLVLLVIPLLWAARRVMQGHFFLPTPLDLALLILVVMVMGSAFFTNDFNLSYPKIAGVLYGVALYYSAVAYVSTSSRRLWFGVGFFLLCGLGVATLSLLVTDWADKLPFLGVLDSFLPQQLLALPGIEDGINPNEIAGVLLWITPLSWVLVGRAVLDLGKRDQRSKNRYAGLISLGVAIILTGILLLSQSRGGLLGLGIGLIFISLAAGSRRQRIWLGGGLLGLAILIAVGIGVGEGGMPGKMLSNLVEAGNDPSANINSLAGRLEIWSRGLYAIQDFPILGIGMNTFRQIVDLLYPLFLIPTDQDIAHAHNQFIDVGISLGIPGLIAYLAIWSGSAGMLWQAWRDETDRWLRGVALGLGGGLVAYFVYGLMDTVALGARPGFIFWLLLGLTAGLHRLVMTRTNNATI